MYWLAGLSEAGAATMIVYSRAPGVLERGDGAHDVGILLADRDVDRIHRPELRVARGEADLVDLRLVDDRVDGDGRLAGAAVADDQLALAAADRDHGVDRHDAGEDRLGDRLADDDAGGDLLDRVGLGGGDRALAVDRAGRGRRPRGRGAPCRPGRTAACRWSLTSSPSFSWETSPRMTQPTSSSSRFSAMPIAPPGNCTISLYITSDRPSILATPSAMVADGAGVLLDRLAGELGDLLFDLFEDGAHGRGEKGLRFRKERWRAGKFRPPPPGRRAGRRWRTRRDRRRPAPAARRSGRG